jgi:hypothetical protein
VIGSGFRKAAVLAALVLAGCDASDLALKPEDAARRGAAITFSETHTRQVKPGNWVAYSLACLDEGRITDARARIVAVSGPRNVAADYELRQGVPEGRNVAFAWVRPKRALPERAYVTVEQTVSCRLR